MLFVESQFVLLFLPLVFFLHEALRKLTSQVWFLIGASLLFYSVWNPWLLLLLTSSVVANYLISRQITDGRNRWLFIAGLLLNLAPLFYFKYSGLIAHTAGLPFATGFFGETLGKLLPLGISFFTFQQIAYLADVHTKKVVPPGFDKYALFITFFPQLIAGPIVHHAQFVPQVRPDRERSTLLIVGLFLFTIGFIKKTQIADNLAHFVDPLYAQDVHTLTSSLKATLGYTFQLYFDFSGYSDMALGLAALFGFRLPQNFNSPYKSNSITEFWRRWHMTLSGWLRDYVYIPLGGNRHGPVRTYINLMLTMLIGGLWHGASWTFVLWGGLHGALLAFERLWKSAFPRISFGPLTPVLTFACVALLWVLFRAENFETARAVYAGFLRPDMPALDGDVLIIAVAAGLCLFPNSNWYAARVEAWASKRNFALDTGRIAARFAIYWTIAFASAVTLVTTFYTTRLDLTAYAIVANDNGYGSIENKSGDFRSNFYSKRIFQFDGPKVFIVGSSFSGGMGSFEFEHDGQLFRSTSLGIGGNGFINSLRSANALLDIPGTHTIFLSASALNFGKTTTSAAFKDECVRPLEDIFSGVSEGKLRDCGPTKLKLEDYLSILEMKPSDQRYLQFQNFAFQLLHAYKRKQPAIAELDLRNGDEIAADIASRWHAIAQSSAVPADLENGSDVKFKWESRNVVDSLQIDGEIATALRQLKAAAEARGIRLVVYDSPTASFEEAPYIYPAGFFDQYRRTMESRMAELGIEYFDLSGALPWRSESMLDFIHPRPAQRREVHQLLLIEAFTKTEAIKQAKAWRK
jgi:alginate O-acetyltransferase complex protein AlgI